MPKLSSYAQITTPLSTDLIPVISGGATSNINIQNLFAAPYPPISLASSASSLTSPLLSIVQSNATFNHYTAYIESNTTTLSNDTLRVVAKGGARGIFIQQFADAGCFLIDATAVPNTTIGANQTVFNIDGANTAFSMCKFLNHAVSTTNNTNVLIQNTQAGTQAAVLDLKQAGDGRSIYIEQHDSLVNPAIEILGSKYGYKHIMTASNGYGLNISTDGVSSISPSNGLAKFTNSTTADTAPILNIDNRSAGNSIYIQNNGTQKFAISSSGKVTSAATAINLATQTPATATAIGTAGDITWDSNYFYVCVATNSWHRVAHAAW